MFAKQEVDGKIEGICQREEKEDSYKDKKVSM